MASRSCIQKQKCFNDILSDVYWMSPLQAKPPPVQNPTVIKIWLLSFLYFWLDQILIITPGVRIWNFAEKNPKNKKNLSAVFFD